MRVEVVLTEADIAHEFAEAIEARDLPEKFFYWFPRSAAEWSKLAEDPELFGGLWASWKEVCAAVPEIGRQFGGRHPTTVLHSIRRIEAMRRSDMVLDRTITRLMNAFARGIQLVRSSQ